MPTVMRSGPYRFYFFSHEPNEPPHIHVDRDEATAKFWLNSVQLVSSLRFPGHETRKIERIIRDHHRQLLEAWDEHATP
jgi:hypothetical protein